MEAVRTRRVTSFARLSIRLTPSLRQARCLKEQAKRCSIPPKAFGPGSAAHRSRITTRQAAAHTVMRPVTLRLSAPGNSRSEGAQLTPGASPGNWNGRREVREGRRLAGLLKQRQVA